VQRRGLVTTQLRICDDYDEVGNCPAATAMRQGCGSVASGRL
jgi:hypothetical protein